MYPSMIQSPPQPPMVISSGNSGSSLLVLFLFCIVIGVAGGILAYFFIFKCKDEDGECTTTSDCCDDLTCIDSKCKKEKTTTVTNNSVSKCGEWDDLSSNSCWPEGYSVPTSFRNRNGNTIEECCRGSCSEWFSDGNTCVSKVPAPGETLGYSEGECCEDGMWYRGEAGKSCNEVCNTLTTATKYCHPDNEITSEERLKEVMSSINFNSAQCGEFVETQYPMCENLSTVDWSTNTGTDDENEPARLSYNTTTTECRYINPNILTLEQTNKERMMTGSAGIDYLPAEDSWDVAYCSLELPDESLFCNCRDTKPIIGEGLTNSGEPGTRSVSPWYGGKFTALTEDAELSDEEALSHPRVNDGYLHGYENTYLNESGYWNNNGFSDDIGIFIPTIIGSPAGDRNNIALSKAERTYESVENECAEGTVMSLNGTRDPGYRCEAITTCTEWFGEDNSYEGCPDELPTPSPGATLGKTVSECCGL